MPERAGAILPLSVGNDPFDYVSPNELPIYQNAGKHPHDGA
jgi:hypothetical protein